MSLMGLKRNKNRDVLLLLLYLNMEETTISCSYFLIMLFHCLGFVENGINSAIPPYTLVQSVWMLLILHALLPLLLSLPHSCTHTQHQVPCCGYYQITAVAFRKYLQVKFYFILLIWFLL